MKNSKVLKTILFISGLVLILGGGTTLLSPVKFYAMNGTVLGDDINILNFVRAAGGMPVGKLIEGTISEVVIGSFAAFAPLKYRKT